MINSTSFLYGIDAKKMLQVPTVTKNTIYLQSKYYNKFFHKYYYYFLLFQWLSLCTTKKINFSILK